MLNIIPIIRCIIKMPGWNFFISVFSVTFMDLASAKKTAPNSESQKNGRTLGKSPKFEADAGWHKDRYKKIVMKVFLYINLIVFFT